MMDSNKEDEVQSVLTNPKLCTICQENKRESLVKTNHTNFKNDSYNKLLEYIHKRAKLGNSKYISVSQRLRDVDEKYLIENKLSWHATCYKLLTNT